MKKHFILTSLVAIAMSCPAVAATDVTFGGAYNNGASKIADGEPADVTYSYVAGSETITGVASTESPDKSKFTYTGTDGNETNLSAGEIPTQSEYTATSSATGVVAGPSELVSGMTLNKSDYTYQTSQTDENGESVFVALGEGPLDVVKTITLSNEAATEITVKNAEGASEQISGKLYSFTTVDGVVLTLNEDATGVLRDGLVAELDPNSAEDVAEFERVKGLYEEDKQKLDLLVLDTEAAYATETANFNSAKSAFDADTATLVGLNEDFATVGTATKAYDVALQAQSVAQASKADNDALYQAAKDVYDAPILETISNGAKAEIDNALAENGAIRNELDQKVNRADAENIFAEKQQWVDNTLGIESANSNAVSDALTGEIAGDETTFAGAINAIDGAVSKNTTDIATNAENIAVNKAAIETNATDIAANKTAIESEVANRIAGDDMTLASAKAYVDSKNELALKSAYDYTDKKVDALEEDLSAGIASAAAMSSVAVSGVGKGEVSVGGGYGYYNSQSAVALGAAMGLTDNWSVNAAAGLSDSNVTFRAGTNYKFKLF